MKKMKNYYSSDENLKSVGDRVAIVKNHLKLNITEFSKQLEISHSFLSQIISGKRKPSYEFLCALSVKYNINLHWLFTGVGEMLSLAVNIGPGINLDKQLADPEVREMIDLLNVPKVKRSLLSYADQLKEIFSVDIREYIRSKSGKTETSREVREAAVNE
ncbi:MAG: hypothetical protein QG657_5613 [Acidobacteriota bacterium]|nr:hypothetical protein [Acidobacteriota bacterium]